MKMVAINMFFSWNDFSDLAMRFLDLMIFTREGVYYNKWHLLIYCNERRHI